ncbi:fimbria/pilus outer membrane usher protein, partial [Klebsiella pneumoniae]
MLYGGVQNAGNKYQSYALGVGKNIGSWGAFSADAIHSRSMSTVTAPGACLRRVSFRLLF